MVLAQTKRWACYPHQWGPGKVHLMVRDYSLPGIQWRIACRQPHHRAGTLPDGREVSPDVRVTCRMCARKQERNG